MVVGVVAAYRADPVSDGVTEAAEGEGQDKCCWKMHIWVYR